MPRPRLPRTQWLADSLRVETRPASLADDQENSRVFSACLDEMGEVRLRLMLSCYGPGTETRPKARYFFLLGESATIHARGLDEAAWFREELLGWLKSLDGVRLEEVVDSVTTDNGDPAQ